MGWRQHNGISYYYQSQWIDGRSVSVYIGTGELAEINAAMDAERRAIRAEYRDVIRQIAERDRLEGQTIEDTVVSFFKQVDQVVRDVMLERGYRAHGRAWRKPRKGAGQMPEETTSTELATARGAQTPAGPPDNRSGDLPRLVTLMIVKESERTGPILRKLDVIREELSGPNPTPIEKLLIERILVCWADCYMADVFAENSRANGNPKATEWKEKRRTRAHNRYLSALKALASVRKTIPPSVVVNSTGNTQVNITS